MLLNNNESFVSTDAPELMQKTFPPQRWFVKNLLGTGCYILASLPKMGKSLWTLMLGLSLTCENRPFLGSFETNRTGVCILALEDRLRRIQQRLWDLTEDQSDKGLSSDLRFVESAERLDSGLIQQMEIDFDQHKETGVYVVDTYAAVRKPGQKFDYGADYSDFKQFVDFADRHNNCVLVCHHLHKTHEDANPFLAISGTTGLTGAVTGMFVLWQPQNDPEATIMSMTGKDILDSHYKLALKQNRWELIEPVKAEELVPPSIPDCIHATVAFMAERQSSWQGSTAKLAEAVGIEIRADVYGRYLAQHRSFLSEHGIHYERVHTRSGNISKLTPISQPQVQG